MNRPAVVSVLALVLVSVSACAVSSPSNGAEKVTPGEAKETVLGYYADVRDALGSDAWSEMSSWGTCQMDDHRDEVQWTFSAQRFIELPSTPKSYGEQVAAAWKQRGLEPSAGEDEGSFGGSYLVSDPPPLSGVRSDGGFTQISIDPRSALFRATSACIPGRLADMDPPQG